MHRVRHSVGRSPEALAAGGEPQPVLHHLRPCGLRHQEGASGRHPAPGERYAPLHSAVSTAGCALAQRRHHTPAGTVEVRGALRVHALGSKELPLPITLHFTHIDPPFCHPGISSGLHLALPPVS